MFHNDNRLLEDFELELEIQRFTHKYISDFTNFVVDTHIITKLISEYFEETI